MLQNHPTEICHMQRDNAPFMKRTAYSSPPTPPMMFPISGVRGDIVSVEEERLNSNILCIRMN
jgi:hypothetical protein